MPVNRNPYYGQDIGAAFGSIAQLFAPPSGTDAYGYTKAASERQQMGIQQKLMELANDPTLTPQQKQDAYGIAANFFAPTQSNRAVDVDRSTKLDTNRADNAAKIKEAELNNARQFAEKRYGPVSEGQVLPALPKTVADMYRVPESGAVQGITKLSDGQTAFGPDGAVSRGQVTAKPGEVIMPPVSGAPQAGAAPAVDPVLDAITRSKAPGGAPVTLPPTVEGATSPYAPAINGSPAPQPNNATAVPEQPYGVNSVVRGGPAPEKTGMSITTNPDGTTTVSYGPQTNGKLTEVQGKYSLFATRAAQAADNMDKMLAGPYKNELTGMSGASVIDYIGGMGDSAGPVSALLSNATMSPQGKQFYQAANSFLVSVVRPDSGAALVPSEWVKYGRVYLPMPGDTDDVLAQKATDRRIATNALASLSNGGANTIAAQMAKAGIPIPSEIAKYVGKGGAPAGAAAPAAPSPGPSALPAANTPKIPPEAAQELRNNPGAAAQFDEIFGKGAAASILGGAK